MRWRPDVEHRRHFHPAYDQPGRRVVGGHNQAPYYQGFDYRNFVGTYYVGYQMGQSFSRTVWAGDYCTVNEHEEH